MKRLLGARNPLHLLIGAVALVFFFAPATAYVLGTRASAPANRPITAFPDDPLANAFDTDTYDQISAYGLDRMPLRSAAVKARVRLTRRIFGELPTVTLTRGPVGAGQTGRLAQARADAGASRSQQVILGSDDWLYLGEELTFACSPDHPRATVTAGLLRLNRLLRRSGRRLLVLVAPDKSTVVPQLLPDRLPERECAFAEKRARLAALAGLGPEVRRVDAFGMLTAHQRRTGEPIYLREDTHWSTLGSTLMARAIAAELQPDLARGTRFVQAGDQVYVQDLSRKTGDPHKRRETSYEIRRDGVTTRLVGSDEPVGGFRLERFVSTAAPGGAGLHRPRTLFYGDSFAAKVQPLLLPYFADVTRSPEINLGRTLGDQAGAESAVITQLLRAQTVIVVNAERGLWGISASTIVAPRFLDKLARALARA